MRDPIAVQLFHPEFDQGATAVVLEFLLVIRHGEFEREAEAGLQQRSALYIDQNGGVGD